MTKTHTLRKAGHDPLIVEPQSKIGAFGLMRIASTFGEGGTQGVTQIWEALHKVLGPEDLAALEQWSDQVDATIEELMGWIMEIIGVITDRPTEGPSSSPSGQPETNTGSTGPGDSAPETPAPEGSAL